MNRSTPPTPVPTRPRRIPATVQRRSTTRRTPGAADLSLVIRDARNHYRRATADQILAAARHAIDQKAQRLAKFTSPAEAEYYLCAKLSGFEHEVFAGLFLDNKHRLIAYTELFRGTIDGATVHVREVVKEALRHNAAAVVFAHNHPSGNPEPSPSDRVITEQLREGLHLIGVRTLDHIVVAGNTSISMAQRGWL